MRYSSLALVREALPHHSRLRRYLPTALFLVALAGVDFLGVAEGVAPSGAGEAVVVGQPLAEFEARPGQEGQQERGTGNEGSHDDGAGPALAVAVDEGPHDPEQSDRRKADAGQVQPAGGDTHLGIPLDLVDHGTRLAGAVSVRS